MEQRLIDANALIRDEFEKTAEAKAKAPLDEGYQTFMSGYEYLFKKAVDNAPTIEAVSVIRCRDCVFGKGTGAFLYCSKLKETFSEYGYCSFGTPREER